MGARLFVGSEAGLAAGQYIWAAEGNIVLSHLGQWRSRVLALRVETGEEAVIGSRAFLLV